MEKNLIKVFTTADCPYCGVVKAYLHSLKVEFEEVDLTKDAEAVAWLEERIGRIGVPITFFNESEYVLGWQKTQLESYLRQYKFIK